MRFILNNNPFFCVIRLLTFIYCLSIICCCNAPQDSKYLRWIGDSEKNDVVDDATFKLCGSEHEVIQYFHIGDGYQYKGEKTAILKEFEEKYKPVESDKSGMIRIRFIVNCHGETGRFRIIQSDENYQTTTFAPEIIEQLLSITKALDAWEVESKKAKHLDFYQYLIFKLDKGTLKEILP